MIESLEHSVYFGVFLSLGTYAIGLVLKKKLRSPICNPLLISVLLTVLTLLALDIDYDTYYDGAKYISYLLTPATVCPGGSAVSSADAFEEQLAGDSGGDYLRCAVRVWDVC